MMEVSMKNLLLQMESKSMSDSCMRFYTRINAKEKSVLQFSVDNKPSLGLEQLNLFILHGKMY